MSESAISDISIALNREQIARCESLIRPYVRRTPIIRINGADVGVNSRELCLKLELFQHSGSFKARGAFTNLLLRKVPAAGVAAASGVGNVSEDSSQDLRSVRLFPSQGRAHP